MAVDLLNQTTFNRVADHPIEGAVSQRHPNRANKTPELSAQGFIVIARNLHHRIQSMHFKLPLPIEELGRDLAWRLPKAPLGAFGNHHLFNHATQDCTSF
jgi:hypothetical protein